VVSTLLEKLSARLDEQLPDLLTLDSYYKGEQPLAFLAPDARTALGNRLQVLNAGYPRLVVDSISERLRVTGFRIDGQPSEELWKVFEDNGFDDAHQLVHTEALALGRSFVVVWGNESGVTLSVESPEEFIVERDPLTREVTSAMKRWTADGKGHAVLLEKDTISQWVTKANVVEGGSIPAMGWSSVESNPNPLGVVPVAVFTNRGRLLDINGVSEMKPVLDLTDAISKLLADQMVASEVSARARRWVTGLEIQEEPKTDDAGAIVLDDEGQPVMEAINPFGNEAARVWQSEDPNTKFGQFEGSRLDQYTDAVHLMLESVSAVSGLPQHYLGITSAQPPSADALRSSEASLTARCEARQRSFGPSWEKVAQLIIAVQNGARPTRVNPVWADASTRSIAAESDSAVKLFAGGILPKAEVQARLGYSQEQIQDMRVMSAREVIDVQPMQLPATP
jgi:hypothetical protein